MRIIDYLKTLNFKYLQKFKKFSAKKFKNSAE